MKGKYRIHWVSMEWENSKGYAMCGGKGENLTFARLETIEQWCAEQRKRLEAQTEKTPNLEDLF